MRRRHYVPMKRHHDIPIKRRKDVPLRRCWVFHLRRTCDVIGTFVMTAPRRLVAGWGSISNFQSMVFLLISTLLSLFLHSLF